jgi:hypothetical protein
VTADDYLRSVSFELGDLPWGQRQDLLTEIRAHLDELPAGTDLRARLGTPKEYAADHCRAWPGTGSTFLYEFPVRYRFLWKTATAEVPLPEKPIVFKQQKNCG